MRTSGSIKWIHIQTNITSIKISGNQARVLEPLSYHFIHSTVWKFTDDSFRSRPPPLSNPNHDPNNESSKGNSENTTCSFCIASLIQYKSVSCNPNIQGGHAYYVAPQSTFLWNWFSPKKSARKTSPTNKRSVSRRYRPQCEDVLPVLFRRGVQGITKGLHGTWGMWIMDPLWPANKYMSTTTWTSVSVETMYL